MSAETRILLLRGVNVSGANRLPMAEFRDMLDGMGLGPVQTYIQSGNALVSSALPADVLADGVRDRIATRFGFAPAVFLLGLADLRAALTGHPFTGSDPARVHAFFLAQVPPPLDDAAMTALAAPGDGWHLAGRLFLLHTPAGIGRSRLADRLHHHLPGAMTARNLRTVAALVALAAAR